MNVNRGEVCVLYSSEQIQGLCYPGKKEGLLQTCLKLSQVAISRPPGTWACHTVIKQPVLRVCGPHLHPHLLSHPTWPHHENVISPRWKVERNWMVVRNHAQELLSQLLLQIICLNYLNSIEFNSSFCPGILTIFLLIPKVIFPFRC